MSGKADFFNDSSPSSPSSDSSSSSGGSSTSKRIRQLLQYKQIQPKDVDAVRKLAKQQRASKQSRKKSKNKKERKKKKKGSKPPRVTKGGSDTLNQYRQSSNKITGQIDYQKIIDKEGLSDKMRMDNYAILLYLIDNNDQEVRLSFQNHIAVSQGKHGAEQSNLLAEVQAKTEETYLVLLEEHLSNREQSNIFSRRSGKDEEYIDLFK